MLVADRPAGDNKAQGLSAQLPYGFDFDPTDEARPPRPHTHAWPTIGLTARGTRDRCVFLQLVYSCTYLDARTPWAMACEEFSLLVPCAAGPLTAP